ncbi:acetate--CoA ligase family protein [Chloroflexota bacterium]
MNSAKSHFLDLFLYPESVAIVGASRNANTRNFCLLSNLVNLKYPGEIYPVNPNSEEILGLKAYPDLQSIVGDIDLAVIAVPASKTLDVVRECVVKRVKGITLVPGGFSEIGEKGKGLQDEIFSLLRESGIRAIGPNALSPINTRNKFIISFHPVGKLPQGKLSFVFQSGLYEPRLDWLLSNFNLYLSKLIDLGNKMDINEVDALEYLAQDAEAGVIAIHMESIAGDARKFMQLLKHTTREKPVIILKSGRTEAGAKAASSHTGAIVSSSDAVIDVALRQAGAIRAQGLDEFLDLAKIFEYLPPLKKNRIAIAAISGGEGVITTDSCQLNGLTMAELSPETHNRLRSIFPPWDIPVNPLDTGVCGQFNEGIDVHGVFLQALADDPNVDCLAMNLAESPFHESAELVKLAIETVKSGKPLVTWVTDPGHSKETIQQLESNRIPVYPSAERAIKALSALYRYYTICKRR